jgi:hypothetical protein
VDRSCNDFEFNLVYTLHSSTMICALPYFAILLTITFVAFATCILLFFPEYCHADKCNAEGVDNTVIFWSTDFFVGISAVVLAFHLKRTTMRGLVAESTFLLVGLGYFLKAFAALYFGSSGLDDGKEKEWFYVLTALSHIFWAFSAGLLYTYFVQAWHLLTREEKPCGSWQGLIFLVLVVLSTVAILVATVVNSTVYNGAVETRDHYSDEGNNSTVWMRVVAIARTVFSGCYSFFLICGASIFGGVTRKDDVIVWGLPVSFAAGGIVILQVVAIGVTVFYGLQFLDADGQWEFQDESRAIVHLIFSYAMMMTYFFLHNLVFALLPEKGSTKNLPDTDGDSDSQSGNSSDEYQTQKGLNSGAKNVLLVVASDSVRSENNDNDSRTRSTSFYGNTSSFPTHSFCSTSFDTRTAITDVRTFESSPQGNIFEHFFLMSPRKAPNGESSTVSVCVSSQATEDKDNDKSVYSHETEMNQDSPSATIMIVAQKVLTVESSVAKEEKTRVMSEQTKSNDTTDCPSQTKIAEQRPNEKFERSNEKFESRGQHRRSQSTQWKRETVVQTKKLVKDDMPVCSSLEGESCEPEHQLSQGTMMGGSSALSSLGSRSDDATRGTKTESSIWNGCRENVELPLDTFRVFDTKTVEEPRKKRTALLQSLRRLTLFKSEDERSDASVTRSTVLCEASIWNGHKDAFEVPLGGDRDVSPSPPSPPKTESRRFKKPTALPFVGNKWLPHSDSEISKMPQNNPGFEIIYDDFVAE